MRSRYISDTEWWPLWETCNTECCLFVRLRIGTSVTLSGGLWCETTYDNEGTDSDTDTDDDTDDNTPIPSAVSL